MTRSRRWIWIAACLVLSSAGCAATGGSPGSRLLREGNAPAAVPALRQEEAADPGNFQVKRALGIALFQSRAYEEAAAKLAEAHQADPRDATTLFYLGRARDEAGEVEPALDAYSAYLRQGGKARTEVRARIQALSRLKARRDVERALAREESLRVSDSPPNSVAVPDFVNVARNDSLAPLSSGLAVMVMTDLNKVSALRVLEHERLQVLLNELQLASARAPADSTLEPQKWSPVSTTRGIKQRLHVLDRPSGDPYYEGPLDDQKDAAFVAAVKAFQAENGLNADGIDGPRTRSAVEAAIQQMLERRPERTEAETPAAVDPKTAPRLGKLLGARTLIQGTFVPEGEDGVQLDASLIEAAGGTSSPTGPPVAGPLRRILHLEKELVYQILSSFGITPTREEKREIDRLPTEDFLAFLAYSRGLVLEDAGRFEDAAAAYREAVRIDAGYGVARDRAAIVSAGPDAVRAAETAELRRAGGETASPRDRLLRTGTWSGLGPGPETDRGAEHDPSPTDVQVVVPAETGTIIIEGELPTPGGTR